MQPLHALVAELGKADRHALVAVGRLGYVQVLGSERYVAYGAEQRIRPIELSGGRGSIFDREGNDLAISIPQTTIAADPSVIADPAGAAPRLAQALGQDEATVLAALESDGRFVYLARQVGDDVADRVRALDIDGVLLYKEQARFNPAGDLGRSLLGQVSVDGNGLSGVEQAYERELHGTTGFEEVETSAGGRAVRRLRSSPATPGNTVVLSIDIKLQGLVEQLFGNRRGALVAIDPRSGEVLAFVSKPTFDPNLFVEGIDVENWRALNESIDRPLLTAAW